MAAWTAEQVAQIAPAEQVQVLIRRRDGSLSRPTTIWVVGDADRLFSAPPTGAPRHGFVARSRRASNRSSGGTASDVSSAAASEADLSAVDAAYRRKYGHYQSIVDHLIGSGPRAATLQARPA